MPTGPGGLDANGVWQYGEDDTEALASDLLNLGMGSVSTVVGALGSATILQVLSATKTDTFSTTSTSFTDVTGLTLTLTPAATSSKVLVSFSVNLGLPNTAGVQVRLMRDSTPIAIGDAGGGSQKQSTTHTYPGVNTDTRNRSMEFLDSPNTTSATVYKLQIVTNTSTVYVNRSYSDNNTAYGGRTASTITAMEVTG